MQMKYGMHTYMKKKFTNQFYCFFGDLTLQIQGDIRSNSGYFSFRLVSPSGCWCKGATTTADG